MIRDGTAQVCEDNIGNEVDVHLIINLETLGKIWFGDLDLSVAIEQGLLKAVGAPVYVNRLSRWLGTSQFSSVERSGKNLFA